MFHRIKVWPLLPVTQGVRILTPGQDQSWVGPDDLFNIHLRVGCSGIAHDVDSATELDGLSGPGIAVHTGEGGIPELVEHLDVGWPTIALLQGMQACQIAIGGFVGALFHPQQFAQRPHLGSQRGKIGRLRVENRDTQLLQRGQHP